MKYTEDITFIAKVAFGNLKNANGFYYESAVTLDDEEALYYSEYESPFEIESKVAHFIAENFSRNHTYIWEEDKCFITVFMSRDGGIWTKYLYVVTESEIKEWIVKYDYKVD